MDCGCGRIPASENQYFKQILGISTFPPVRWCASPLLRTTNSRPCDSLVCHNLLFHCLFFLQLRINLFFAQNIKPAKITRTHIIVKRKNQTKEERKKNQMKITLDIETAQYLQFSIKVSKNTWVLFANAFARINHVNKFQQFRLQSIRFESLQCYRQPVRHLSDLFFGVFVHSFFQFCCGSLFRF